MEFLHLYLIIPAILPSLIHSLVITKLYNPDKYVDTLYRNPNKTFSADLFLGESELDFCHILRQSRIYHVVNSKDLINTRASSDSSKIYELLELMLDHERRLLQVQLEKNSKTNIQSIHCLDLEGSESWIVSNRLFPNTAILYQTKIADRLLIDESFQLITSSTTSVEQRYLRSLLIQKERKFLEPLCLLEGHLRFRLCAISADALENLDPAKKPKLMGKDVPIQYYRNLSSNFYFEPKRLVRDEICRRVAVSLSPNSRENFNHRHLYCYVKIEGSPVHKFFIGQNIRNNDNLFIIQRNRISSTYEVKLEIHVPLLRNIELYNKLFQPKLDMSIFML